MVLKIPRCQHHADEFLHSILRFSQLIAGFAWPRHVLEEQVILSKVEGPAVCVSELVVCERGRDSRRVFIWNLLVVIRPAVSADMLPSSAGLSYAVAHTGLPGNSALGGKRVRDHVTWSFSRHSDSIFGSRSVRCPWLWLLWWADTGSHRLFSDVNSNSPLNHRQPESWWPFI